MLICPTCRVPTKLQPSGLYRCGVCGMVYKPGQSKPLLSKFAPASTTLLKSSEDQEMEAYIQRVTRKLLPTHKGYTPAVIQGIMASRAKIAKDFERVAEGHITLQAWVDHIHSNIGKHPLDIAQILLDCTEGFTSQGAKEFQQGCAAYLQYMQKQYNPNMSFG
jgi:hypothetical protein